MKQGILALLFITFLCLDTNGQRIKWTKEWMKKTEGAASYYRLLGHDKEHYYVCNSKVVGSKGTLTKYNFSHKKISTHTLEDIYAGEQKMLPVKVITTNGGVFLISVRYQKFNRYYSWTKIDGDSFSPPTDFYSEKVQINDGRSEFDNFSVIIPDHIQISKNKEYVFFHWSGLRRGADLRKIKPYKWIVFDKEMNIIWEKTKEFTKDIDVLDHKHIVTNNGEVLVPFTKKNNDKKRELFIAYGSEKGDPTEHSLNFSERYQGNEDKILFDLSFTTKEEGNDVYLCALAKSTKKKTKMNSGFIPLKQYANALDAVVVGLFDTETKKPDYIFSKLPDKTIQEINERNKEMVKDYPKTLTKTDNIKHIIEDFVIMPNGNLRVIVEKQFPTATADLVILTIENSGSLQKAEQLKRIHGSAQLAKTSYTLLQKENKTYLLYNDHKSWMTKKEAKAKGLKNNLNYAELCTINEDGDIEKRKTLFNVKDVEGYLTPSYHFSFATDEYIIFRLVSENWKKYKFGRLSIYEREKTNR